MALKDLENKALQEVQSLANEAKALEAQVIQKAKDLEQKVVAEVNAVEQKVHEYIQNEAPIIWQNFDQFWNACVKNGNVATKEACQIYLKTVGLLDKPEKWIQGVLAFGIKIEK